MHFRNETLKIAKSWDATTGVKGQVDPSKEDGPIPVGKWAVLYSKRDNISNKKEQKEFGAVRYELFPFTDTKDHTRKGFFIHGGKEAGTAHGIDLVDKIESFADAIEKLGKDMVLVVKTVGNSITGKKPILAPNADIPTWLQEAEKEAKHWQGSSESEISKEINYHKEVGVNLSSLEGTDHAWCASFVNYCLKKSGYKTFSPACRARAISTDSNFKKIENPFWGCIVLVGSHHVGFYYGLDKTKRLPILLGGNQSDQINFTAFPGALTYYTPVDYDAPLNQTILEFTTSELNQKFGIVSKKKAGDTTR